MLESSATKRDARAYLKTFGQPTGTTKPRPVSVPHEGPAVVREAPRLAQRLEKRQAQEPEEVPHVAIVKFRNPQLWEDDVLDGVAKTLIRLRTLGLLSVIVVDCDSTSSLSSSGWRKMTTSQAERIAAAVGRDGMPGAKIVESAISCSGPPTRLGQATPAATRLSIAYPASLTAPLQAGYIAIVPSHALSEDHVDSIVDSNEVVLALAKYFSGLQIPPPSSTSSSLGDEAAGLRLARKAIVDRIIVLDPIGGTPTRDRPNGAHVFINMEDEYESARAEIERLPSAREGANGTEKDVRRHLDNLKLARDCLSVLPSASSTIITSPAEAADFTPAGQEEADLGVAGFVGSVGTRRKRNPLIHNLLTDRPVYSSSLPLGRIKPKVQDTETRRPRMSATTLAKRGLPVTIFPDPRRDPWLPPQPGAPRLRLTDTCIDLPRLIYLINDSFDRKLDAQHYLDRVSDSLAGIIIAGEYEGGAILTWERPFGLDEKTAYDEGRLVPYLDKFAILKRSQGAGGVADIVFNAMVGECFPDGVCWRSRKNNPVNKWYFERSRGAWKLDNSNWAMFWTTPGAALDAQKMQDYEDVCRNVAPSWADKQKAAD